MATLVGNRRKDPQPLNPGQQGKLIERIEAMYQICRANTVKEVSWSVRRQLGGLGRLGYSLVFCISALSLQPTHARAARASGQQQATRASGVNTKSPNFQTATLSGLKRASLT